MKTLLRSILAVGLAIGILAGVAPAASAGSLDYTDVYASSTKIYPKADGYRDSTKIDLYADAGWSSDACIAEAEVAFVRAETGGTVERHVVSNDGGCYSDFSERISWSGRGVPLGRYRVEVAFLDDGGWTLGSDSTTVTTATGTRTLRMDINRDGMDYVTRSKSGNCNWGRLSDRGILSTCGGGRASVVYRASVPRGYAVKAVRTYWNGGIVSCKGDRFSKSVSGRKIVATFSQNAGAWTLSQCAIYGIVVIGEKTVRI